jgi:hypothetical protein
MSHDNFEKDCIVWYDHIERLCNLYSNSNFDFNGTLASWCHEHENHDMIDLSLSLNT